MKKIILLLFAFLAYSANADDAPAYSFGVRITRKGRPMILIPGYKGSADTYNETVAHFKSRYKCYVITLAGFAGQPPSGVYDHLLQKQRDDIIRYIIEQKIYKPVLVGFSFGGVLATWIACTRPDITGPLIDIDGTPFDAAVDAGHFDKDSLLKTNAAQYNKVLKQNAAYWIKRDSAYHSPQNIKRGFEYVQKLVSDTNRIAETLRWDIASDFRSALLMGLEADTLDMRDDVAKIRSPVLMLGSWQGYDVIKSKDDAIKRYGMQYAKAKNVTMVFSERGKHFLMWEDFNWMTGQMDKFLAKYGVN